MWQCRHCGVVFADTVETEFHTGKLYQHYYDRARFVTPPTVVASLENLVRFAARFRASNRWFDLGFGEGGLLSIAERHGWVCHGSEISEEALDFGRQRGWAITSDPSADPRVMAGSFDVVTMIEVLEHVRLPRAFLTDAARWLRLGGLLYLTTPNIRSLNGRILGQTWSVVSPPEHLVLWTAAALRCVLAKAGFRLLRFRAEGLNPSELLARMRRRCGSGQQIDRNQAAIAWSEALSRTLARRILKNGINQSLSLLRLGDTLKVWALRVS
jgi:2-polyprenyl-3-methyl-5-hydroxy-6-metoxy-1,4-benzoquinol methylase